VKFFLSYAPRHPDKHGTWHRSKMADFGTVADKRSYSIKSAEFDYLLTLNHGVSNFLNFKY